LDISKNTALTWLNCWDNQLTAAGLNALFGTLHNNNVTPERGAPKTIYIGGNPGYIGANPGANPGTKTCDKSIAENKGWKVYYYMW